MKFVSNNIMRARPLLGTIVEITASGLSMSELQNAIEAAFDAVARVHALMSFHDGESDVSRLNRAIPNDAIMVDQWTYAVLAAAAELERLSSGRFNVAIAPALEMLGMLPRPKREEVCAPRLTRGNAFELLSDKRVRLREPGGRIDLGGIAKGFAVDRAIDVLRRRGVVSALVNAGGDLAAYGPNEQMVAIRDLRDPHRLMCRVAIQSAAIASSGRLFDALTSKPNSQSAIIDPENGNRPRTLICGATVRAPTCMVADALTKVVILTGIDSSRTLDHYGASALFMKESGEVKVTADWQDIFPIAA
jgi:FAD:protein FMN transferase